MDRQLVFLVAVAVLGASAEVLAQPSLDPPRSFEQERAVEVTDADLRKFAAITVELQETANRFESQLLQVKTEEEAKEVQARMQQESVATVTEYGWTPEQYVLVTQIISADPKLADRARAMIDRRPIQ
jgi:hypothetical protein